VKNFFGIENFKKSQFVKHQGYKILYQKTVLLLIIGAIL